MPKNAKRFLAKLVLGDTMEMIGRGHRAPANKETRMNIRPRPFKNLGQFLPIGHVFERQRFDRRASNNETIKFAMFDRVPVLIKADQMLLAGILRRMPADHDQSHFDLQRAGANQTRDLRLSANFVRHQVEQANL